MILSGEDLANVGPVALLQDLTVMATLGIEHVERNGHHYFSGLSMIPPTWQQQILHHHGDLYRLHPNGYPTLRIEKGALRIQSLIQAPFGLHFPLDPSGLTPLTVWEYESLGA